MYTLTSGVMKLDLLHIYPKCIYQGSKRMETKAKLCQPRACMFKIVSKLIHSLLSL